ncbi:MAG: tetratricopeptide repeat protein [Bacteroidia bacterium]
MTVFDQLLLKLSSVKSESELLEFYIMLWENGVLLKGEEYSEMITKIKNESNESDRSRSWLVLSEGFCFTFFPSLGNAFEKLTEALDLFRQLDDKNGEGATQSLIAIYFKNIGQLDKAQENIQSAILNINENKTYIYFLGVAYYQAGEIHHLLKDYTSAINFFNTGYSYSIGGAGINARLLNAIGTVYRDTNELDKAFDFFQRALKEIEGKNNHMLESKIYADIGNYYYQKEDFSEAFSYQQKSIEIRKKNKLNNSLITNYIELAELFIKQNIYEEALKNALFAEEIAKELNVVIKLYQVYLIISTIYEATGNTSLALEYHKKYHQTKEEVFSQESARKMKQISMHHEMETMQKEKEIFKLRNVVLKEALDEIGASVRYAQRIQEAILPPIDLIKEKLPDTFVLYKPKDIVAGDFYWMEEINDTILIAAADCTGHGVPGAIVSVICSNALNRAVKEFQLSDTGAILNKVTDLVLETFEKSIDEVKDGMDISMLSLNKKTKQIQWSGANNSLIYFDEGELKEIAADKQPIGKSEHRKAFTTHTISYNPGTSFYLFTDGYADQFGGPKGKKLMYKQFKEILSNCLNKEPVVQMTILNETFENWRADLEQVDDVCVIGFKI